MRNIGRRNIGWDDIGWRNNGWYDIERIIPGQYLVKWHELWWYVIFQRDPVRRRNNVKWHHYAKRHDVERSRRRYYFQRHIRSGHWGSRKCRNAIERQGDAIQRTHYARLVDDDAARAQGLW